MRETPRMRSRHVIDHYDDFLERGLSALVRSCNPVRMPTRPDCSLEVFVGGDEGRVRFDAPSKTAAQCRAADATYDSDVRADLVCRWTAGKRSGEEIVQNARIMTLPIMLGSVADPVASASDAETRAAGECPFDEGGYFVVDGREKVVQAIEYQALYRPLVTEVPETDVRRRAQAAFIGTARTPGPGRAEFAMTDAGDITVTFHARPDFVVRRVALPLFTAMRALGCGDTDESIVALVRPFAPAARFADVMTACARTAGAVAGWNCAAAVQHVRASMGVGARTEDAHAMVAAFLPGVPPGLRAAQLGVLVGRFLDGAIGPGVRIDRDSACMKRVADAGAKLAELVGETYRALVAAAAAALEREHDNTRPQGLHVRDLVTAKSASRLFQAGIVTDKVRASLKGAWIERGAVQDAVVQELPRASLQAAHAYTCKVTNPMPPGILSRGPRELHGDTFGYICPSHTPEGRNVGLVRHMCLLMSVSVETSVDDALKALKRCGARPLGVDSDFSAGTCVTINDVLAAVVDDPLECRDAMIVARRSGAIPPDVSVAWLPGGLLEVRCDAGRMLRPLLVVRDGSPVAQTPGFAELQPAALELVDPHEMECCRVAMTREDLEPRTTHMELHGSAMLSATALMTPYSDHNAATRNVFSCKQMTACASLYASNFAERSDALVDLLHYGQRALVTTRHARAFHCDLMPYGENAIVAIMCASGYNQEDSIIMNEAAVQRGLFHTTHSDVIVADEEGRFAHPLSAGCVRLRGARFDKIDGDGLPLRGVSLEPGDVVVGRVGASGEDSSVVADVTTHGVVAKVDLIQGSPRRCKVTLADFRPPTVGDKFASRHGQKGIVGRLMPEADMPWTADGMVPDLIINPHALPSRMTVGQILEALFAKAAACDGDDADGTPFMEHDVAAAGARLAARQRDAQGDELCNSGLGGQQQVTPAFVAPTYYLRLKQQVRDKVAASNGGRRMAVTGQPTQGRANGGGLRMGEMEHDCVIAHGVAAFVKETNMERSDKPSQPYAIVDGAICCDHAETGEYDRADESAARTEFFRTEVPIAFKVAVAELGAMGVRTELIRRQ